MVRTQDLLLVGQQRGEQAQRPGRMPALTGQGRNVMRGDQGVEVVRASRAEAICGGSVVSVLSGRGVAGAGTCRPPCPAPPQHVRPVSPDERDWLISLLHSRDEGASMWRPVTAHALATVLHDDPAAWDKARDDGLEILDKNSHDAFGGCSPPARSARGPGGRRDTGLMLILEQPNAPASRIAVHGPLDARTAPKLMW